MATTTRMVVVTKGGALCVLSNAGTSVAPMTRPAGHSEAGRRFGVSVSVPVAFFGLLTQLF